MSNAIAQALFAKRTQDRRQRQKQSNAVQERPDPCHYAKRDRKMEAHTPP